jgi:hypothetical protein
MTRARHLGYAVVVIRLIRREGGDETIAVNMPTRTLLHLATRAA